jgi:thiamine-phosphate pyrophosphorylase
MSDCRLYLISPNHFDLASFDGLLEQTLLAGDVACFQLRLKDASDDEIRTATQVLMPICHSHNVAFILNDRADLAKELNTDGVHIGVGDGDIKDIRAQLGHDVSIGATCHDSKHLAFTAGDAGADYVAFGAFFPSDTKETSHVADVSLIEAWVDIAEIPCVAIGGITVDNAKPLIDAGADFIAVSSGVWNHADGAPKAVQALNQLII